MEWHVVYAKFDGCKGFRAFDVKEGRLVGDLIYASLMENTEETRAKLQRLADLNKECHLILQLRRKERSVFRQSDKGNGQPNQLPTTFFAMDELTIEQEQSLYSKQKREQIKALIEKMKREGKTIDWTTAVLC